MDSAVGFVAHSDEYDFAGVLIFIWSLMLVVAVLHPESDQFSCFCYLAVFIIFYKLSLLTYIKQIREFGGHGRA